MIEMEEKIHDVEARACPFCGGEAGLSHVTMLGDPHYHKFTVYCKKCYSRTADMDSKEEAIKRWNTRVGDNK